MPTLLDYEYQYGDGVYAVKLNKTTGSLPIWDVYRVSGLDMPSFRQIVQEVDGQHGADVFARYLGPRAITVEGELWAATDAIDTQMDLMKDSLIDVDGFGPRKFYFKHPGIVQRYCEGKAVGFVADTDRGRRTGKSKFLLSILCEDPITYFDNPDIVIANATNAQLINDGNIDTSVKVILTGGTLSGTTTIRDQTNGVDLTFALTATAPDRIEVDTALRRIQKNNVDVTASVIADNWWLNKSHGATQLIKVSWTGTTGVTVKHKSGWW